MPRSACSTPQRRRTERDDGETRRRRERESERTLLPLLPPPTTRQVVCMSRNRQATVPLVHEHGHGRSAAAAAGQARDRRAADAGRGAARSRAMVESDRVHHRLHRLRSRPVHSQSDCSNRRHLITAACPHPLPLRLSRRLTVATFGGSPFTATNSGAAPSSCRTPSSSSSSVSRCSCSSSMWARSIRSRRRTRGPRSIPRLADLVSLAPSPHSSSRSITMSSSRGVRSRATATLATRLTIDAHFSPLARACSSVVPLQLVLIASPMGGQREHDA